MYVHVHMPQITHEGQRTTCRSSFFPSTVWVPRIELRSSVVANAFPYLVQPDWFKPPACLESFKLELNFGNTVFSCDYRNKCQTSTEERGHFHSSPDYLTCCKALIIPVKKSIQQSSQAHQETWSHGVRAEASTDNGVAKTQLDNYRRQSSNPCHNPGKHNY